MRNYATQRAGGADALERVYKVVYSTDTVMGKIGPSTAPLFIEPLKESPRMPKEQPQNSAG